MKRKEVYQIGSVIPNLGWKKQPPLVYVTSSSTAIGENGKPVSMADVSKWEYRGTVSEKDLQKIESKGK